MTLTWSAWREVDSDGDSAARAVTDPYHHWAISPSSEAGFANFTRRSAQPRGKLERSGTSIDLLDPFRGQFIVPPDALPDPSDAALPAAPWSHSKPLPDIAPDSVIMGVIDTDIPLGHSRTRLANGHTRIISAWQMLAPYSHAAGDTHMPYGRELLADDIDAALEAASGGSLTGRLDEDAFNTATFGLDMSRPSSSRRLAGTASHGAHVLDVAAGADQHEADDASFRERLRIIAVNAPNAGIFGPSGTYMNGYLLSGVQHIVDTADRLWQHASGAQDVNADGARGFPIVINISFGTQSGSKDFMDDFANQLRRLHAHRKKRGLSRVRIVMPTGNDNLDRCNAYMNLESAAVQTLDWRILPEDHSSNFAEVWIQSKRKKPGAKLALNTPMGDIADLSSPEQSGKALHMCEVSNDSGVIARVYHQRKTYGRKKHRESKDRFVLCIAPTARHVGESGPIAPAGRWQIALKRRGKKASLAALSVQTDQRLSGSHALNKRSYFEDPAYQMFGVMGEIMETYSYPTQKGGSTKNQDIRSGALVKRHGTQNASAAHGAVASVGGFRKSDGRPAQYSSSGMGRANGKDIGVRINHKQQAKRRLAPRASFVTDDSPSLFGILASGARDGSVVAMRGTSFASSQGARFVASALLNGATGSARKIIRKGGKRAETMKPDGTPGYPRKPALIEVLGRGRIEASYREWQVTR